MYNSELKTRFLKDYTQRIETARKVEEVFNRISKFEEKYQTDFACMSNEQATEVINSLQGTRACSIENTLGSIRKYVSWNIEIGTPDVNKGILELKPTDVSHIKSKLVKDPIHLARILNKSFAPVEEKTIENIFRFYVWGYYMGMSEEQILKCTKDDIDYKKMVICIDDEYFQIFRESLDVITFCADSEVVAERRHAHVRDFSTRAAGTELYRGVRQVNSSNAARVAVSKRLKEAFHSGAVDVDINRRGLWLSGMFYRMYERESLGFPVDFTNDAIKIMSGKEYKTNRKETIGVKRHRIVIDLQEDYENWKIAYDL